MWCTRSTGRAWSPRWAAARLRAGRELTCLVQVSLDGSEGRGGAQPASVAGLADAIAAEPGLALGGVMAVAPLGEPARPAFARLARGSGKGALGASGRCGDISGHER